MGASRVTLAFGWVASFFRRVVLRLAFILLKVTAALAAATGVNGVAQTASSIAALRLPRCGRRIEFLLLATRFEGSRRRRPPWLLQRVPKLPPARVPTAAALGKTGREVLAGTCFRRGLGDGKYWWMIGIRDETRFTKQCNKRKKVDTPFSRALLWLIASNRSSIGHHSCSAAPRCRNG